MQHKVRKDDSTDVYTWTQRVEAKFMYYDMKCWDQVSEEEDNAAGQKQAHLPE